jgi:hypothetical protein
MKFLYFFQVFGSFLTSWILTRIQQLKSIRIRIRNPDKLRIIPVINKAFSHDRPAVASFGALIDFVPCQTKPMIFPGCPLLT